MRRLHSAPLSVVITGASSGIGRATALQLARAGARLTLCARSPRPLEELADECRRAGAQALVVPADVTDEDAVVAVARAAADAYGGIDVWVNNAGVLCVGLFEDTPPEAFRRVLETNFFGAVHGARAALEHFRRQHRGVLINVGSLDSRLAEPYAAAYVASKHALRGLSQSLRQELEVLGERRIHVCLVMPATIDTPLFQHAANWSGRAVKAMPPVYPPERVARCIARLARRPRREVFVGTSARLFQLLSSLAPGTVERFMAVMSEHEQLSKLASSGASAGNLFSAMGEGAAVRGGWKPRGARRVLRAAALTGLAAAPVVAGWRWLQTSAR